MSEPADLTKLLFGRLSWESLPLHEPILIATFAMVVLGGAAIVVALTYFKLWGPLWRDWITSIDHKKIGIMYVILGLVMLLRGFSDAIMMRAHQAVAFGETAGYLPPHHYDQIFTAHGVIMIFFVAMPLVTGLMNFAMPLQIGARDVAFPFLNNFSFWMTASGAGLIMASLFIGEFAKTGWLAYPPLSGIIHSPDVGVDYYIWSLQVAGVGTTLSGINLIATIVKMRAPGMGMMKMPIFTWTTLCANILIVAAFPVLTAALALLSLDRYVGTHFFTNELGGNAMMYVNLIWIWGHPEVYILILPAFGIFSEVVSTYSGKRLFGYASMVYATVVITILSYLVWLHHFFTMGSGASVNSFFGIATMIISIPTGAKIFNWLFTMYRGRIRFEVPMLWTISFMVTFVVGGMTGVLLAVPPADFVLHNSLFLVAHFHNVIIGGVVFGLFAGITYWFPKAFGFKLDPYLGQVVLLVLDDRFLRRLHAAVRPGPERRHPPPQPLPGPHVPGLVRRRRFRRRADRLRHRMLPHPALGELQAARGAARHHGRPLERPHAGVVHVLAAARLQLRFHADHPRIRRLVRHEEARLHPARGGLHPDPHAEEHPRGLRAGHAERGPRLRPHLAHVARCGRGVRRADRRGDRAHVQLRARLPPHRC